MAIPESLKEIGEAIMAATQRGELVGWVVDVRRRADGSLEPFNTTYNVGRKHIDVVCFKCDGEEDGGVKILGLNPIDDYTHAVLAEEKAKEHGEWHKDNGQPWFIVRIFG